jgi:hypothetical protein
MAGRCVFAPGPHLAGFCEIHCCHATPRPSLLIFSLAILFVATGCRRSGGSIEQGDEYYQKRFPRRGARAPGGRREDPRNGAARQKLAASYRELGAMEQAWGEYVRAADLLPDSAVAQLDAADALLFTGQFEDARSRAEKVLAKDPKNVRAHTVRGLATAGLKDTDRAVDEIQKALELDPSRATTYANLAVLQLGAAARRGGSGAEAGGRVAPTESHPGSRWPILLAVEPPGSGGSDTQGGVDHQAHRSGGQPPGHPLCCSGRSAEAETR